MNLLPSYDETLNFCEMLATISHTVIVDLLHFNHIHLRTPDIDGTVRTEHQSVARQLLGVQIVKLSVVHLVAMLHGCNDGGDATATEAKNRHEACGMLAESLWLGQDDDIALITL